MVLTGAASRKALLKIIWLNSFSCERRAVKGVRTRAHALQAVAELAFAVLSYPSEAPFQQQRAGQAASPSQDRCVLLILVFKRSTPSAPVVTRNG
jgi:hypothetical protein